MANSSISQLETVANVTAGDLLEVATPNAGSTSGYKSGKESLTQISNFIAMGVSYAGLATEDQTIVGSINEVKAATGSLAASVTDAYDDTATYEVGDLVIYNNTLYKCASAVVTPEDFDDTKWTATTILAEVERGIDTTATTPIYEAYTTNGSDALTYTATQDCLVSLTCQGSSNDSMTWDIDGAIVLTSHYQAPYPVSGTFPLKAGQTASKRIVTSQCFAAISVNAFE